MSRKYCVDVFEFDELFGSLEICKEITESTKFHLEEVKVKVSYEFHVSDANAMISRTPKCRKSYRDCS